MILSQNYHQLPTQYYFKITKFITHLMQTITAHIKLRLPRWRLTLIRRLVRLLLAPAPAPVAPAPTAALPPAFVLRVHRFYVQQQRSVPRPEHPRTGELDAPAALGQVQRLADLDRTRQNVRVVSPEVLLRRDRVLGALQRVERHLVVDGELAAAQVTDAVRVLSQERDLDTGRSGGGVQREADVDVAEVDWRGQVQLEDVLVPGGGVGLQTPRFSVLVAGVVYALIITVS